MNKFERYQELKKKVVGQKGGYMRLSSVDKREYSSLKTEFEDHGNEPVGEKMEQPEVVSDDKEKNQSTQIERLIEMNNLLNQRISSLEQEKVEARSASEGEDYEWKEKSKKFSKRTAKLLKWQPNVDSPWMIAVNRKLHTRRFNPETRQIEDIYKIMFLREDGESEEIEMPLLQYARIKTFVPVTLEKEYAKELRKQTGETRSTTHDYHGFKSNRGGIVPMYVDRVERSFDAMLPDGRVIRVHDRVLNGS